RSEAGFEPSMARLEARGYCGLVWARCAFFPVIGGDADDEAIATQADSIRDALALDNPPYDREQLRKRLGYLTGGVATLNVGAATKTEMAERKARAEKAVKAVESGRRDGVVAGGGEALLSGGTAREGNGL